MVASNRTTHPQLGEHCWPHVFDKVSFFDDTVVTLTESAATDLRGNSRLEDFVDLMAGCNKNLILQRKNEVFVVDVPNRTTEVCRSF